MFKVELDAWLSTLILRQDQARIKFFLVLRLEAADRICLFLRQKLPDIRSRKTFSRDLSDGEAAAIRIVLLKIDAAKAKRGLSDLSTTDRADNLRQDLRLYVCKIKYNTDGTLRSISGRCAVTVVCAVACWCVVSGRPTSFIFRF